MLYLLDRYWIGFLIIHLKGCSIAVKAPNIVSEERIRLVLIIERLDSHHILQAFNVVSLATSSQLLVYRWKW